MASLPCLLAGVRLDEVLGCVQLVEHRVQERAVHLVVAIGEQWMLGDGHPRLDARVRLGLLLRIGSVLVRNRGHNKSVCDAGEQ